MSTQDKFLDQFNVWATLIFANLAWVVLAVLLVTAPLGTAGLFQVMSNRVRGKPPEFFRDFVGAIRRYWVSAFLIGLLDVLGGGLVYANLTILLGEMDEMNVIAVMSLSGTVLVALVLLMTNMYIWSLLVVLDLPLPLLIKRSFQLVMAHPFWSLGVLLAASIPIVISPFIPVLFFLLATIALSAWIINKGTWRIIRRYIPETELNSLEADAVVLEN